MPRVIDKTRNTTSQIASLRIIDVWLSDGVLWLDVCEGVEAVDNGELMVALNVCTADRETIIYVNKRRRCGFRMRENGTKEVPCGTAQGWRINRRNPPAEDEENRYVYVT
jgi:hypothetical protein